jgi:hypothetical protein
MQPQANAQADQYKPKWRHFHPQATVWIVNPFDHIVEWKVADESNVQAIYKIQARERAELPGGPIASLGIKIIIDELIQNDKNDVNRIYDLSVREKYEDKVILRVKEAPASVLGGGVGGPIDLSIKSDKEKEAVVEETVAKPFDVVPENKMYSTPTPSEPNITVTPDFNKDVQTVESD